MLAGRELLTPVLKGDFEGFINGVVHDSVSHQISNWRAHCHAIGLLLSNWKAVFWIDHVKFFSVGSVKNVPGARPAHFKGGSKKKLDFALRSGSRIFW